MYRILSFLFFFSFTSFGQKSPLDHLAYQNWPEISETKISNNGKFILYTIETRVAGPTMYIQSSDNSWQIKIDSISSESCVITDDSRFVIFTKNDSLAIYEVNDHVFRYIRGVKSFIVPTGGRSAWLVYESVAYAERFVLMNLNSGVAEIFDGTRYVTFNQIGSILVLVRKLDYRNSLNVIDLDRKESKTIWTGKYPKNISFSNDNRKFVFISEDSNSKESSTIWIYRAGDDSAKLTVSGTTLGMEGFSISTISGAVPSPLFSRDGDRIFFTVSPKKKDPYTEHNQEYSSVHIWSYSDNPLLNEQMSRQEKRIVVVYNFHGDRRVLQVQDLEGTRLFEFPPAGSDDFVLSASSVGNVTESDWNPAARLNYFLVSTRDGKRHQLNRSDLAVYNMEISFSGKYVTWFDLKKRDWFSYDIITGAVINISKRIKVPLFDAYHDTPGYASQIGEPNWLINDTALLVNDQYDIWEIDPKGNRMPVNVTAGYGRRNKIIFRYVNIGQENGRPEPIKRQPILLSAFNTVTKENGFYLVDLLGRKGPVKLSLGAFASYFNALPFDEGTSLPNFLLKARDSDQYVVKKMTVAEYPNLYATNNFVDFKQLTKLDPQKEYNWLKSEIIHWNMPDGSHGTAILYKPENFNAQNRYPLIFFYYESFSNNLNLYLNPTAGNSTMSIPWYVSNGYLVCVPDIKFRVNYPGESVLNSVVSASKYFSKFSWVGKMGLQGHSFGGYETNYLITHTDVFSAACSSAGPIDLTSMGFSLFNLNKGVSRDFLVRHLIRINYYPWKNPSGFVENSPIYHADKVSTPLLILQNRQDGSVPWEQGMEWFLALRTLQKKVWMLEYDQEGHALQMETNQIDFSIRLSQFFDHYLKGVSAPSWLNSR